MPNKAQLEADYHQRLTTRFSLKDATSGKVVTAHQTFVRLMNVKTKQEVIYVAEEDDAGSYRFDLVRQHVLLLMADGAVPKYLRLGLDRYHIGTRYPLLSATAIPIPGCTIFCTLKMWFCVGYRCVQVIYVCGVYAQKYDIGLKLQACVATVLTVETGKWTTGLLESASILK